MLKQGLQQKLQQGLSPLQIQTIKLLELPTLELEQRIKKELEENPVLDEAPSTEETEDGEPKNVSLSDYNGQDDSTPSYRLYVNNQGKDLKPQYNTFSVKESFHQNLEMQLGYSDLEGDDRKIASFIIGSIDDDGYLRRDILSLTDDIAFRLNIETTPEHVEEILKVIQEFEPVASERVTCGNACCCSSGPGSRRPRDTGQRKFWRIILMSSHGSTMIR